MELESARKRVRELTEQINHHDELYYQQHRSEISDEAFDKLLNELVALEAQFPELLEPDSPSQRVGGTITREFAITWQDVMPPGNSCSEPMTRIRWSG